MERYQWQNMLGYLGKSRTENIFEYKMHLNPRRGFDSDFMRNLYFMFFFSEHGISVEPQEVSKLSDSADEDGEVTKDEFMMYARHSEFFKNQLGTATLHGIMD